MSSSKLGPPPNANDKKRSRLGATLLASGLWLLYFDLFTSTQGCADASTPPAETASTNPPAADTRAVHAQALDRMALRATPEGYGIDGPRHHALIDAFGTIRLDTKASPQPGKGLALTTSFVRRGDRDITSGRFDMRFANGDVLIHRGALDETITGTAMGVEQRWSLEEKPAGSGAITIAVALSGAKGDRFDDRGLVLERDNGDRFVIGHATWVDAKGVRTPSEAQWNGTHVLFRLPESVLETTHFPISLSSTIETHTVAAGDTCSTMTVTPSAASPQAAGTPVAITAAATCTNTATAEYQFYLQSPGGVWTLAQAYGASGTFNWDTTGRPSGTYAIQVRTRAVGSAVAYDTVRTIAYELTGGTSSCGTLTVAAAPASPQAAGGTVNVTGTATCSSGATAEYQFYLQPPGGNWSLAQSYSTNPTFAWSTATAVSGTYTLQVRTRAVGSTDAFDTFKVLTFDITGGAGACGSLTTSASPTSPQAAGTSVTLSGNATCTAGATAEYQMYMLAPGGGWTLLRDWATTPSFAWNTSGAADGAYTIQIRARAQGTGRVYDAVQQFPFTVTGGSGSCGNLTVSATPPGSTSQGGIVTFTGNAQCTLGASAVYQFFYLPPGGRWTLGQAYNSSPSFSWNTTGAPTGTYSIQVRSRASTSSAVYEGLAVTSYTVTVGSVVDGGVFDSAVLDSSFIDAAAIVDASVDAGFSPDASLIDAAFTPDASFVDSSFSPDASFVDSSFSPDASFSVDSSFVDSSSFVDAALIDGSF